MGISMGMYGKLISMVGSQTVPETANIYFSILDSFAAAFHRNPSLLAPGFKYSTLPLTFTCFHTGTCRDN